MISAVFGSFKSLLQQDGDPGKSIPVRKEEAETSSTRHDDDGSTKSAYSGLEYGQYIADARKKEQGSDFGKETSSFSGKVTDLLYGYGLINSDIYFTYDCVIGGRRPNLGAVVDVEAVRDHDKGGWKATKVSLPSDWDIDQETTDGQNPQRDNLIGTVTKVNQDSGFINETVPFDQDSLVYGYKPCRGDWIQGDMTYDVKDGAAPRALNVRPLREQKFLGSVSQVYPGYGHVNGKIYFSFRVCEGGWRPKNGDSVEGMMIEAKQSKGNWRAVSMKQNTRRDKLRLENAQCSPFARCLEEGLKRNQQGITITEDLNLGSALLGTSRSTTACVRNVGEQGQTLTNCEVCCPTGDVTTTFSAPSSCSRSAKEAIPSSILPSSSASLPVQLPSQSVVYVTLTVKPKQLGKCLCQLTFIFGDFSIRRLCTLSVQDQQVLELAPEGYSPAAGGSSRNRRRGNQDRRSEDDFTGCVYPGVRPTRNFDVNVPVKLPQYPVPRDLKSCVVDGGDLLQICPQLTESLCMENFSRSFSTLLHLEELQMDEDMREFDLEKVSMRPRGEFLSLEVPGLAEGRPSVLIGDKIIVTHPNNARYDGFIHEVLGEAVLLKFHPSFHDLYQAELCSVTFTYSRTSLRRCHQACAFAEKLGKQVIFPTIVEAKPPQVSVTFRRHAIVSCRPLRSRPKIVPRLPNPGAQKSQASPMRLNNKRANRTPPRFTKQKASPSSASAPDEAKFVTPRIQDVKISHVAGDGQKMAEFINPRLNARQQSAVIRILQGEGRPLPYIIFGPPGTGKTVTVVEAVLQVHIRVLSSRILACTPSNSAADLLTERLCSSGKVNPRDLVRLNAFHRSEENIPDCIKSYCKNGDNLAVISHQRIIVCTCTTAGSLYQQGLQSGHFTHVFVDEAGQATEPECLIPAGLAVGAEGQVKFFLKQPNVASGQSSFLLPQIIAPSLPKIILAGDPMQLGPVLSSHIAKEFGLGQSFLERLILRKAYRRDAEKYRDHGCYDPLLVTKLVENYRSHPVLLKLSSRLFYHDELLPRADPTLVNKLTSWEKLPNQDGDCPLLFHGVIGADMREGNSPSWFNPVEVVQVVRYVQALLNSTTPVINPEDIGIITPYRKQVEKVKMLLNSLAIDGIKVGSVEEFQGQERVAMVISTVRSSEDLLNFDLRHHLGFLSNPKRFNVSISRAQALMIIVGNPHVLAKDLHWRTLIQYCQETGAYTGCQLPIIPPQEHQDDEESLDEGREPDFTSSQQQEKEGTVDDSLPGSLKDSDADDQRKVLLLADETEEAIKRSISSTTSQSPSHVYPTPDVQNGCTPSTIFSAEAREMSINGEDSVNPGSGNTIPDLPAVVDELPGRLSLEDSSSNVQDSGEAKANPSEMQVNDEPVSVTVTSNLQQVLDPSTSSKPNSYDRCHFLTEDVLVSHGNHNSRTESPPAIQRFILPEREFIHDGHSLPLKVPVGGDVLVESKIKRRTHTGLSFSSSSDLDDPEECGALVADADFLRSPTMKDEVSQGLSLKSHIRSEESASFLDAIKTEEDLLLREQAVKTSQGHQEANNTDAQWSSGTFSHPEICDPDQVLRLPDTDHENCDNTHPVIDNHNSSKSPKGQEPNQRYNGRVLQDASSALENVKPSDVGNAPQGDLVQISSQDDEDPEIWDEEYICSSSTSRQRQEAGSGTKSPATEFPARGINEPSNEVTEKWDDYTWDVGPKRSTPTETQNNHTRHFNTQSTAHPSNFKAAAASEEGLLDSYQEMPPLEDWSQGNTDLPDTAHESNSATALPLRVPQQHQGHERRLVDNSTSHSMSVIDSEQLNGRHGGSHQGEPSSTRLPTTWGLGRGRGLLNPALKQGGSLGHSTSRQAGHKSRLGLRKVGAPTYSCGPKPSTQLPPRHQEPRTSFPKFEEPGHVERDHTEPRITMPKVKPDPEAVTYEGNIQHEADCRLASDHREDGKTLNSNNSCNNGSNEDCDGSEENWEDSHQPHFFYKKPLSTHKKGGKWKYATNHGAEREYKQYTRDEDFMGDGAARREAGWNHQGPLSRTARVLESHWDGSYPVAQSAEMMDDYDVIIESNGEEGIDSANTKK